MSKAGHHPARKKALVSLLVICAALLALLGAGCSGGGSSSSSDPKAMREAIGKFYAAQGALDIEGMKAVIYDPTNTSGIATATVPPEAQKAEVNWKSVGETVLITVPSRDLTLTVAAAKSPENAVTLSDPSGQSETIIMKKDGGVWKIDVVETQKATAAKAGSAPAPAAP